jgi:putative ABC transport system ATP-binding protein
MSSLFPLSSVAAVQLESTSKVYSVGKTQVKALDGVNLTIPAGRFIAIMGASGSGKSTLLHLIAGLASPTSGEVTLFGQAISKLSDKELTLFRRRHIGLIFQAFNLLPTLTALENVSLPLLIDRQPMSEIQERAKKLLSLVHLEDRLDHRPDELSGGQQQRVAIARSLINEAKLILADEPTGNLDSKTGESILLLLRELVKEHQRTIVMVTHDPKAAAYADHVITLSDGQIVNDVSSIYNGSLIHV